MEITKAYQDFLQMLHQREVAYLIAGAYAVNYYGYSRPTDDLDVWVEGSEENNARLLLALQDFGFSGASLDINKAAGNSFSSHLKIPFIRKQLGKLKLDFSFNRIHLKSEIAGMEFEACYRNRSEMNHFNCPISFMAQEDLVAYKKMKKRPKDKKDIKKLPVLQE